MFDSDLAGLKIRFGRMARMRKTAWLIGPCLAGAVLLGAVLLGAATRKPTVISDPPNRLSESTAAADPLLISPETVEFGRVNDGKGPLELSFTIDNRGDQPIEITGAR